MCNLPGNDQYIKAADKKKLDQAKTRQTFVVRLGKRLRPYINAIIAKNSLIGDVPVFDPASFAFTRLLEKNWEIIRDEAIAVTEDSNAAVCPLKQISPDHGRIAADVRWKSFFLFGYGYKVDDNCARCPQTTKILEQIPGINSGFFSVMEAHGGIPRHKGVTKAILTCHLGLIVPKEREKCHIQVDDQTLCWEEGKTMVFDDTFEHEVWNETGQDRIVLLVQFKRPVRFPGNLVANLFLAGIRKSSFVQTVRRNLLAMGSKSSKLP